MRSAMLGILCKSLLDFNLQLTLGPLQAVAGVGFIRVVQTGSVDHLMRLVAGHDEDAITSGQQFGEFRGDHDDPLALRRLIADQPDDFGFRPDVDACGRFVQHQDIRVSGQPFADYHLLLVAARKG